MLKFWKMFDSGSSSPSSQDMSKKTGSQVRQRNGSVASLKAKHRASAYFAMPTTTTSNDSITQQRHHSCIFSSSSIQLLNNESSMQQQRSSCSKPTQESSTSREWQVIELLQLLLLLAIRFTVLPPLQHPPTLPTLLQQPVFTKMQMMRSYHLLPNWKRKKVPLWR